MNTHDELPEAPFSELTPLVPRAAVHVDSSGTWSARLWDRVLGSLPLVMMGILAALSWWLARNAPRPSDNVTKAPLRHEADYTMTGFSVVGFTPNGQLRSRLEGDTLRHFPDTDTVEVDGVRLRSVDELGRVTLGSARQALSNGDGSQVRLMGDARVVREPAPSEPGSDRIEFRGEFLEVFTETDRLRSHLPVTVLTGRGELRAGSLDYNHLERIGQLGGRVSGELRAVPLPKK